MEYQIADFSFEIPENDDQILKTLSSEGNLKDFLAPGSFTKHKLIHVQPFPYK
jgi:hypothetical protein